MRLANGFRFSSTDFIGLSILGDHFHIPDSFSDGHVPKILIIEQIFLYDDLFTSFFAGAPEHTLLENFTLVDLQGLGISPISKSKFSIPLDGRYIVFGHRRLFILFSKDFRPFSATGQIWTDIAIP